MPAIKEKTYARFEDEPCVIHHYDNGAIDAHVYDTGSRTWQPMSIADAVSDARTMPLDEFTQRFPQIGEPPTRFT